MEISAEYIKYGSYIFQGVTAFSLAYLTYALATRRDYFRKTEKAFQKSIEENKKTSEDLFNEHFEMMQKNTKALLNIINDETKRSLEETIKKTNLLNSEMEKIVSSQEILTNKIVHLNNEIQKKDAIIERKMKQIKRLKKEGNYNGNDI